MKYINFIATLGILTIFGVFSTSSVLAEKPESLSGLIQVVKQLQNDVSILLNNNNVKPKPIYTKEFSIVDADANGNILINHNLGTKYPTIQIFDNFDKARTEFILADQGFITVADENNLYINIFGNTEGFSGENGYISNGGVFDGTWRISVSAGGTQGATGKNGVSGAGNIAFINSDGERKIVLKTDGTVWSWSRESNWKKLSDDNSKYNTPISPSKIVQWSLTSFLDSDGNIWILNKNRWENTGHP